MANNYNVYIGSVDSPMFSFSNDEIESLLFENAVDIIGDELSSDVIEFGVFFNDSTGGLKNLAYGTPIFLYNNGNYAGKYFATKIERIALKKFLIHGTSLIGLIGREDYYGGFYAQARFEDVVDDILFSDGFPYTKYYAYHPVSRGTQSNYAYGEKLTTASASTETYRQRLHLSFVVDDYPFSTDSTSGSEYIAGYSSRYGVYIYAARETTSSPTYYYFRVYYGGNRILELCYNRDVSPNVPIPLVGNGSRVTVDVNPVGGIAKIKVDYIKYDDTSVTGTLEDSANISVSTSSSAVSLDAGFGPASSTGSASSYKSNLIWDYYRVYNADGSLRVDACCVTDNNGHYYMCNQASGIYQDMTSSNRMEVYGNSFGIVGDLTRSGRDLELSSNIEFEEAVAEAKVNGWIPISTRRDALHQLLFANNVSIIKSENGKILFTGLVAGTPTSIADDDVYDDTQEEVVENARKITVAEHSFVIPSGSASVIYDNTGVVAATGQYIAVFNNSPIYGTPTGSGITIKKFNCNAAIVTGRGTISGTPYYHAKNDITYQNNDIYDGPDISSGEIPLITAANSDNIMNKMKAYYAAAIKKIKAGIVYRDQRCGTRYTFRTIFENSNTGFLSKMSAKASSFIKSECEFVSGYIPPSSGGYGSYQIVDYSGSWEVPSEVREREYPNIRLILIGSGHDGTNGTNGADGASASGGTAGNGGAGGNAGLGGVGGNVYQITVDVTNVARIDVSQSGYHTIAKTYNDNSSLISTYNSSSGNAIDAGVTNVFTGDIYARRGKDGYKGGNGGKGGCYTAGTGGLQVLSEATKGEDVKVEYRAQAYAGGGTRTMVARFKDSSPPENYYSFYGGGGGASAGHNGVASSMVSDIYPKVTTKGGHGANAVTRSDVYTGYGSGGYGGNGGGGGGGAGVYEKSVMTLPPTYTYSAQQAGEGGTGSSGTPGIAGCLLIYY